MGDDVRKLLKAIEAQGFEVTRTKKGHWLITTGDGQFVAMLAGTASDWRSWRNAIAALRRSGFQWPPKR